MKKKLLLSMCVASTVVLMGFATPQETVKNETVAINSGIPSETLGINYVERSKAYAQLEQWQNCLNDMTWLKLHDRNKYYKFDSVVETRTKALLAMGQKDEAFSSLYETFLYTGDYKKLITLKELMGQYPEFSNYLDITTRGDLIQKHRYRSENMLSNAIYTAGVTGTENGWYMLKIAEVMGFSNTIKKYNFYNTWNAIANNRYEACQYYSVNGTFNVSESDKAMFAKNGSIDCSYVMSREGLQESLRIAEDAGKLSMQVLGYSSYTSYWKKIVEIWKNRLELIDAPNNDYQTGTVSKQEVKPTNAVTVGGSSEEDTNSLDAVQAVQEGIKTTTDMINNLDSGVKKLNSIKSGLKTLGF